MVDRRKLEIPEILFSKRLNCYPAENQAAKIFSQWLSDNPQYTIKDVNLRIDSYKEEEDYYGNGGGCERIMRIFKTREETQEEYEKRIKSEEEVCFNRFRDAVYKDVADLVRRMSIFPNVVSNEVCQKRDEILNEIMNVVENKLHNGIDR